jgi:thymidylate synthase
MKAYLSLVEDVLENGREKSDRTHTGTISMFGTQTRYSLLDSLPVVTTKRIPLKAVIHELLWMIKGDTNIKYLQDNNVNIWDEWADQNGSLGPVYGEMWRKYPIAKPLASGNYHTWSVDQLSNVINELKENPDSRRLVVSSWHPGLLPDVKHSPSMNAMKGYQALPPCHTMFQLNTMVMSLKERLAIFHKTEGSEALTGSSKTYKSRSSALNELMDDYLVPKHYLSCQMYQRSGDLFLGVPFNVTSYSLLTCMIGKICNMQPYELVHTIGDAHIYLNHVEQVKKQLKREPYSEPHLIFSKGADAYTRIDQFTVDDIMVQDYTHHETIKAPVAV